jgi:hypothetical protein
MSSVSVRVCVTLSPVWSNREATERLLAKLQKDNKTHVVQLDIYCFEERYEQLGFAEHHTSQFKIVRRDPQEITGSYKYWFILHDRIWDSVADKATIRKYIKHKNPCTIFLWTSYYYIAKPIKDVMDAGEGVVLAYENIIKSNELYKRFVAELNRSKAKTKHNNEKEKKAKEERFAKGTNIDQFVSTLPEPPAKKQKIELPQPIEPDLTKQPTLIPRQKTLADYALNRVVVKK